MSKPKSYSTALGTLYCMDCLTLMRTLDDETISLCLTSPPYDNLRKYDGYSFAFEEVAQSITRILKPGGVIVWVVSDATVDGSESGTSFRQVLYFKSLGLNLHDTMIYAKDNPIPLTHNRYEQQFEYMFILSKGKPKTFNPLRIPTTHKGKPGRFYQTSSDETTKDAHRKETTKPEKQKGNIWTYPVGTCSRHVRHPAKYPLQLAIDHVYSWSNQGDLVFDPFGGSGTTAEACERLGRQWISSEISEKYFLESLKRFNSEEPQQWPI